MNVGGIVSCSVGDNDCRWYCVRVQEFIMVFGGIVCVFSSI